MTESMNHIQLNNGLTVHLKEIHTAPIITTWLWYRVGSRNELPGQTGISHWVEHMQFKGTEKYPAGYMDREVSRVGGIWNAMTYMDWTTYFETLPAHLFELSLSLEADRMTNSRYDPDEVERERTVVISEREGNENQPRFLLGEAVQEAAFSQHPYQHEVIGLKTDLEQIDRDALYAHYRRYYRPDNAVLAIAGDFETRLMLEKVRDIFGPLPARELAEEQILKEEPLGGEKRVSVSGPGQTSYIKIAYRAPRADDVDFFALTVLDSLLTGPSSLNMFGSGGTTNKTSRLYRALVEQEVAVSCFGSLQATKDPYLYSINLTVHPQRTPEEVLKKTDAALEQLQETPINAREIERAIKQARALFAFSSENISNQGFWLGYPEMFGSYDWFENYVDHLARVTPEDVLRITQTTLHPDNRVVGFYIPEERQA
jgi:zinc protease